MSARATTSALAIALLRRGRAVARRGRQCYRCAARARTEKPCETRDFTTNSSEEDDIMAEYKPSEIEARWQARWDAEKTFKTRDDLTLPKYYVLDMFPYPSGAGLHVGHPEGYTATDILARYKRMRGFNVLHPMGWDAFGLPAERAAMREGEHPAELTKKYIANFKSQIKSLGFSYDWDREIDTTDPSYYKWTQWIFTKLYERGLAYQAEVPVNWCPAQGTVLANEEVADGVYIETGDPVFRRNMRQWMLRIPLYAERLITDLDDVDWPDSIKEMQRYWIGRSEGAEVDFAIQGSEEKLRVYTTRPDTLFGCTYMVVAPEHALVAQITTDAQRDAVQAYIEAASRKSDLERTDLAKDKSGVWTGANAINPATGQPIPIFISDYVLVSYGTGAIMAVPAHDQRDWDFAKKFDVPIVQVVEGGDIEKAAWTGDGKFVNSGFLDGLNVEEAGKKIREWIVAQGIGVTRVNYRLRDWLFSRQRYWGEPFPILHFEDGSTRTLDVDELPLTLPFIDEYRPTADGEPPLARNPEWVQIVDPKTGKRALRETNTMPQWAGSCWYYLRYIDPKNDEAFVDPELEKYWMPVDLYVGGAEHAVLHLLYARFWHKVLYDCGLVSTKEPFRKLFNQGMILAYSYQDENKKYYSPNDVDKSSGKPLLRGTDIVLNEQIEKMSKSKYNVVNPDEIIHEYGADALRLYEMYMGPLDQVKPWQTDGVRGMYRFLSRAWRFFHAEDGGLSAAIQDNIEASRDLLALAHDTTRRVTENIEALRFNTAIAALIEFLNALYKVPAVPKDIASRFALLLAPFAPHLAEEAWATLGNTETLAWHAWPQVDESLLVADTITVAVQVLGKTRGTIEVAADAAKDDIIAAAKAHENVARQLEGKTVVKEIYVPGKIVNLVVK